LFQQHQQLFFIQFPFLKQRRRRRRRRQLDNEIDYGCSLSRLLSPSPKNVSPKPEKPLPKAFQLDAILDSIKHIDPFSGWSKKARTIWLITIGFNYLFIFQLCEIWEQHLLLLLLLLVVVVFSLREIKLLRSLWIWRNNNKRHCMHGKNPYSTPTASKQLTHTQHCCLIILQIDFYCAIHPATATIICFSLTLAFLCCAIEHSECNASAEQNTHTSCCFPFASWLKVCALKSNGLRRQTTRRLLAGSLVC